MYWWDETYYAGVSWFYEMLRVQISQSLKEGSSSARTLTPWKKVKQNTCEQTRSPHGNQQIFDYISKISSTWSQRRWCWLINVREISLTKIRMVDYFSEYWVLW